MGLGNSPPLAAVAPYQFPKACHNVPPKDRTHSQGRLTKHREPAGWLLLELPNPDQFYIKDKRSIRRLFALIRTILWDPETHFLAFHHELDAFRPPWNHTVEGKGCRSAAYQRAVEPLAGSGPTRVINRHLIELAGMACTSTRLKDSVAETADRTFGIGRGRFDVGGSPSRHINQRNVEYQWPSRLTLLTFEGQRLRNPEPSCLTDHHQLQTFAQTR